MPNVATQTPLNQPTSGTLSYGLSDFEMGKFRFNNGTAAVAVVGPDGQAISGGAGGGNPTSGTLSTLGTVGVLNAGTVHINGTTITPVQTIANFNITLSGLGNGTSRQSDLITNSSNYPAALIGLQLTSGAAPTAGAVYELYLIRANGSVADDSAGTGDAAITIENAPLLNTLVVTSTGTKAFTNIFDTSTLGPLGSKWGIAVKNSSGQALLATEGSQIKTYQYYSPSNT